MWFHKSDVSHITHMCHTSDVSHIRLMCHTSHTCVTHHTCHTSHTSRTNVHQTNVHHKRTSDVHLLAYYKKTHSCVSCSVFQDFTDVLCQIVCINSLYRALFQKRPINLRSQLIEATPYQTSDIKESCPCVFATTYNIHCSLYNVHCIRGEIGGWGRVPFNEPYAPSLSTIYDGA